MPSDILNSDPYLRLAEVEREVGLGRSTIYRRMRDGTFPLARQLGGGSVRWPLSAIKAWKEEHPVGVLINPAAGAEVPGRLAPPVRRRRADQRTASSR
ncbi:helix-turn-helix transcriptional regulator [Roseomonas elaeocarpi]|uniref:Helix-turn-helix transcriptional regulator n=1 Tax=Roseomonas elaeocarpi TaxID=907779 RepID=A0ABV6JWY0_9PROT